VTDFSEMRREMIRTTVGKPAAHLPSAFSILEIVWSIYEAMTPDDRFILSKGHGVLALYAVLKARGQVDGDYGSWPGHPDARLLPHVAFSTGSLGHGLALAAGVTLGKKLKSEPGRVFCLLGDGECMEGSVWEAMQLIGKRGLRVITIIDNNRTHPFILPRGCLSIEGYGYIEEDGTSFEKMASTLKNLTGPWLVNAHSKKGRGCKIFEADPEAWHHRSPTEAELPGLLEAVT